MQELKSTQLLFLFVRKGLEYTLDRNATTRERMGLLLHQLIKSGILPPEQYCKGSVLSSKEVSQNQPNANSVGKSSFCHLIKNLQLVFFVLFC